MNEIREDMLRVKRMMSEVEIILGKREGETELVNKLIDAENLLTYCMSRLENAIVPPCKVGDTVYYIHETFFDKEYMKIVGFQSVKKIVERPLCKTNLMLERTTFDWGLMDSWLKGDIFLTREEAETALAEREAIQNDNE